VKRNLSIRPSGRSVNDPPLWLKVLKALGVGVLSIGLLALFLLIVLEWFSGCGETYIDANGERHAHECIFLSYHK